MVPGIHADYLPTKDEDRIIVFPFQHGTMIAIFDGHLGSDTAEYASRRIPYLVSQAFDPDAEDLEARIVKIFQDFDQALISRVTELFEDSDKDWLNPRWDDRMEVAKVIGYNYLDPQFRAGRRAVLGTTVLLAIIDKAKQYVWVVSLGDSCAVRGRMQKGKMVPLFMNDFHNGENPKEVERLLSEHPGEQGVLIHNGTLGMLSVTRALGDHLMKTDMDFAWRILCWFNPCPFPPFLWQQWKENGNFTPPYLSSTPSVRKFDLRAGDRLVFASDGLANSMADALDWPDANACWDIIMPLLIGVDDERLGHRSFRPDASRPYNKAELLIRNVLFGDDSVKMSQVMMNRKRDDISVIVVDIDELP
uniref:PPM-type phosphatase domain-containing protein n=1 Tax=Mycena chlorophos TaxID=658473 RepID=A0ABQ0KZ73_MYCCL|nr:predicted protein [Mycena chlorophos]